MYAVTDSNNLNGPIPKSLFENLKSLDFIALGNNELTGTISASLGQMSLLEFIYLSESVLVVTLTFV